MDTTYTRDTFHKLTGDDKLRFACQRLHLALLLWTGSREYRGDRYDRASALAEVTAVRECLPWRPEERTPLIDKAIRQLSLAAFGPDHERKFFGRVELALRALVEEIGQEAAFEVVA